jgi:hypothetical protein
VEANLNIPRSTLSGWFKEIKLSEQQKTVLARNHLKGLAEARRKAIIWHNSQKANRIKTALLDAQDIVNRLKISNRDLLDLALAILYFGEGFKSPTSQTAIGNSNPLILKFFLTVIKRNYNLDISKIKCELHLRADQNPLVLKRYWSRELKLPLKNFTGVSVDKRTKGTTTYPSYKGVCVVRCGNTAIQRKLLALSMLFCEQVVSDYMGG